MKTKSSDNKFLFRNESAWDIEITKADGSYYFDADGKKYIDFIMGWSVGNIGWGNDEVQKRIKKFNGPDYVHPYMMYKPWLHLAELLAEITPGDLQKCIRTTGGTESIEAAMQLAMIYTGRSKFVSLEGSYHGNSIGALSIGSSESHDIYPNLLSNCYKINKPFEEKTLAKLEARLSKKDVAAFIMEPIVIALGVEAPTVEFVTGARALCKKYGTLFIADEVASGFGRTGKLFACEYFDLEPDILCMAKSISGGYGAIGATITTEKIAKKAEKKLQFYSTNGWHPLSVEASIATIEYIQKNHDDLLKNVNEMGKYFRSRLENMKFKHKGTLHVKGLAICIDVAKARYASAIEEACRKKGLLIISEASKLFLFPSLNINEYTAHEGLTILEECL